MLAVSLAACATRAPLPTDAEYAVSGRVGAQYTDPNNGRQEQIYGSFEWVEHNGTVDLTLIDPLGQAIARIVWSNATTSITLRDGRRFQGNTPEDLTRRTLGWVLPLGGMKFWLRGRADKDAEIERDDAGRITKLRQDNWIVRYHSARDDPPGRPSRIDLNYVGTGPEIALKLIMDP